MVDFSGALRFIGIVAISSAIDQNVKVRREYMNGRCTMHGRLDGSSGYIDTDDDHLRAYTRSADAQV